MEVDGNILWHMVRTKDTLTKHTNTQQRTAIDIYYRVCVVHTTHKIRGASTGIGQLNCFLAPSKKKKCMVYVERRFVEMGEYNTHNIMTIR